MSHFVYGYSNDSSCEILFPEIIDLQVHTYTEYLNNVSLGFLINLWMRLNENIVR